MKQSSKRYLIASPLWLVIERLFDVQELKISSQLFRVY